MMSIKRGSSISYLVINIQLKQHHKIMGLLLFKQINIYLMQIAIIRIIIKTCDIFVREV